MAINVRSVSMLIGQSSFPQSSLDKAAAHAEVIFVAGYGAAATDVPDPLIHANKFMLGHLYAHPESVSEGNLVEVPQGSEDLLWAYRLEEADA